MRYFATKMKVTDTGQMYFQQGGTYSLDGQESRHMALHLLQNLVNQMTEDLAYSGECLTPYHGEIERLAGKVLALYRPFIDAGFNVFDEAYGNLAMDPDWLQSAMYLGIRRTYNYVDSCSHNDNWLYVGSAYAMRFTDRYHGTGNDHGRFRGLLVTFNLDKDADDDTVILAIKNSMNQISCSCEHDCCGCRKQKVTRVRKLRTGLWAVRGTWSLKI